MEREKLFTETEIFLRVILPTIYSREMVGLFTAKEGILEESLNKVGKMDLVLFCILTRIDIVEIGLMTRNRAKALI